MLRKTDRRLYDATNAECVPDYGFIPAMPPVCGTDAPRKRGSMPSVIEKIVSRQYEPDDIREIKAAYHGGTGELEIVMERIWTRLLAQAVGAAFAEAFGMAWDWMYNKSPASREAYIDFMMKQASLEQERNEILPRRCRKKGKV